MRDEARKPDEEPREEPEGEGAEEGKPLKDRLGVINMIQQNAVIVTGRKAKGGRSGPEKPSSERWL